MKNYRNEFLPDEFVPEDIEICPIDPDAEVEAIPEYFGVDKFLEFFGDKENDEKEIERDRE